MIYEEYSNIKAWTQRVQFEDEARRQVERLSDMPFIEGHIAIMPDVHWGMGSTVGSVFATRGAIIPAAVGVDIGCGMMAVKLDLKVTDLPDNLQSLRFAIEKAVPHGRTDNGGLADRGAWGTPCNLANMYMEAHLAEGLKQICEKHPKLTQAGKRAIHHLGTLGGGNHFIEICLDEVGKVWVMLHSGSRGIGNKIGQYFIEKAKKDMERWFIRLPDADLAYISTGSDLFSDYWFALNWAQKFASYNREVMMQNVLAAMQAELKREDITLIGMGVNCHHNYATHEKHFGKSVILTRKGAVKITPDTYGIIPGSMGAKSYIVRGIEGEALRDAYNSCSHGAGRAMSRRQAHATFTLEDHRKAVEGVECRIDEQVIDETPAAYKDIDAVMAAQADHVEIVHTLKQVLCVKG